jgi:hypothetical protein
MGIRGTAVLAQVNFDPNTNQPQTSVQVLVEPDGKVGSVILYDKTTLQPLALVAEANVQTNISSVGISQSSNPLTPEQL